MFDLLLNMEPTKEQLTLDIGQNKSLSDICKKYGLTSSKAVQLLLKYNLQSEKTDHVSKKLSNTLKKASKKKYQPKDNYFNDINQNSAYVLGFLTMTSHIWKNERFLTVNLNKDEVDTLTYLRDQLSPDTPIRQGHKNMMQFCICSEDICKFLIDNKINLKETPDLELSDKVPEQFKFDYLRGIFDAGGEVKKGHCQIISFSHLFLAQIQVLLNNLGDLSDCGKVKDMKTYKLKFLKDESRQLHNLIYNGGYSMKSKKDLFDALVQN